MTHTHHWILMSYLFHRDSEIVAQFLPMVLNLPDNCHIAVRKTSIKLVGELSEWVNKHPDVLGKDRKQWQEGKGKKTSSVTAVGQAEFDSHFSNHNWTALTQLFIILFFSDAVLQFFLSCIQKPHLASVSALSIESLCLACHSQMNRHFDVLAQVQCTFCFPPLWSKFSKAFSLREDSLTHKPSHC